MRRLEKMNLDVSVVEPLSQEVRDTCIKWLNNFRQSLISGAASARERGESWRSFKIGCSLLALGKNLDLAEPQLYTSANYKPESGEHDWPSRKCGEMSTVFEAIKDECRFIAVIVTVSSERSTLEHGTEFHDVVHPCKFCRELFRELINLGVMSTETIVLNVRDDGKGAVLSNEEHTVGRILEIYNDINHDN